MERFWSKVDIRGPNACWPWTASTSNGYGMFWTGKRFVKAHRYAFTLERGELPDLPGWHGAVVRHDCDNRLCCNPAHLRVGTQADNLRDMDARGRRIRGAPKGERQHLAKLTADKVRRMRALRRAGWIYRQLATEFAVTIAAAHAVCTGSTWKHVSPDEDGSRCD